MTVFDRRDHDDLSSGWGSASLAATDFLSCWLTIAPTGARARRARKAGNWTAALRGLQWLPRGRSKVYNSTMSRRDLARAFEDALGKAGVAQVCVSCGFPNEEGRSVVLLDEGEELRDCASCGKPVDHGVALWAAAARVPSCAPSWSVATDDLARHSARQDGARQSYSAPISTRKSSRKDS